MKKLFFIYLLFISFFCQAEVYQIHFRVDMSTVKATETVSIRGSISPLSWDKDFPLTDADGDGIYEANITFDSNKKYVYYKFQNNGKPELEGSDNRIQWFKPLNPTGVERFNEFDFYDAEQNASIMFTPAQIKEDISVLKSELEFLHPSLYAYISKEELNKKFVELEKEILAKPSLVNSFNLISKFVANIQCSHTFTNLWNQGKLTKKAMYFQPNKLPFTFSRLGKQIFVDRNASENKQLQHGLEVLAINGITTDSILTELAKYIASDGANYEKRLQRLTITGQNKFELFDIFFSSVFGNKANFELELKNHTTEETFSVSVKGISKTKRASILQEKYSNLTINFEDGWKFKFMNDKTAYLKAESFAIFSDKNFDWKGFVDDSFKQLKSKKTENLIIDIRGNEGGYSSVGAYILERLVTEPTDVKYPYQQTAYQVVPDSLKKYISTWEKEPYNWGNKVEKIGEKQYKVKDSYKTKTFKPKKNGFKGKTYLLVGADNSSATQIMAIYTKQLKVATLVGQETGGNLRGLNGGHLFFLKLPNTQIEIDIPLFKTEYTKTDKPLRNGGVLPDVLVQRTVNDLINGVDSELKKVMELIEEGK